MALMTEDIPGFGGFKVKNNGAIEVFIKGDTQKGKKLKSSGSFIQSKDLAKVDQNIREHFKKVFGKFFDEQKRRAKANGLSENSFITYISGTYDYASLQHWRKLLFKNALDIPGIIMLDIDETDNKIDIEVQDPTMINPAFLGLLSRLGIPRDAINIEQGEAFSIEPEYVKEQPPGSGGGGSGSNIYTLDDMHGKYVGGISISRNIDDQRYASCTLGMNVTWDNGLRKGFVTASHCTDKTFELDNTQFYQGNLSTNRRIGSEVVDRELFGSDGDSICDDPRYLCRYSDVALVEYNSTAAQNAPVGFVAKPSSVGTDRLDGTGALYGYEIQGTFSGFAPFSGYEVHKVGKSTGLTTGEIIRTCGDYVYVEVESKPYDYRFLCIGQATYYSEAGDSGGPVLTDKFHGEDSDPMWPEVKLMGFHLGSNSSSTMAIFSNYHYTIGSANSCNYFSESEDWLNSELCDEPNFGPYEFRESLARD